MKKVTVMLLAAVCMTACNKVELPADWREQNMKNFPNEQFLEQVKKVDAEQTWNVADMNPQQWATGVTITEIPGTAPSDSEPSETSMRTRGVLSDLFGGGSNYGGTTTKDPQTGTKTEKKVADFFSVQEGKEIRLAFKSIDGWAKMTVGVYYYETDGTIVKKPAFGPIVGKNYSTKNQPRLNEVSIKLEQGTCFGLYIEAHLGPDIDKNTYPTNQEYIWYSESRLNEDGFGHVELTTETTTAKDRSGKITTTVKQTIGFEDTDCNVGDHDYNDFILTVNTPIEEGEIPIYALECDGGPWMILCEDLGNGADNDFNDVIFVVRRPKADKVVVEYVAGGSTIKDYILYNNNVLGEIHNIFGVEVSYTDTVNKPNWFVNTKMFEGRPSKSEATWATPISSKEITVDKDLTMAMFYRRNPDNYEEGFSVKNMNSEVPFSPTYKGYAPYMICVPANGFRWPQETKSIFDAYPEFKGWAQDHTKNTDWYLHPNPELVVDLDEMLEFLAD